MGDYIPDFRHLSEYIWVCGLSLYVGFKCISVSDKEYRFLVNNMLFQLDSESIFEMMDDFPEFVLGTSIRGEGKMACPVLFNLVKIRDTKGIKREHLKQFVKERMKVSRQGPKLQKCKLTKKEFLQDENDQKGKSAILKGALKAVMLYVERYKKIKVLEEEGIRGVKKIQSLLEGDSVAVGWSRRRQQNFLIDEMKRLEKSLLSKRGDLVGFASNFESAESASEGESREELVSGEMQKPKGFVLFGKKFAVNKVKSKDEEVLEQKLKEQIQTEKNKNEKKAKLKSEKIRLARMRLAKRRKLN